MRFCDGCYYPTIMDGSVVRWHAGDADFEVNASRHGVSMDGRAPVMDDDATIALAKKLHEALAVYRRLRSGPRNTVHTQYQSPGLGGDCPALRDTPGGER